MHTRPLHALEPGRAAEAGALVHGPMEGLEPVFPTCSDARSSTSCCRRWAARRSAIIDGHCNARRSRKIVAGRNIGVRSAGLKQLNITVGPARPGSALLSDGVATNATCFKSRWAAYPSGKWRRCQVNQRNRMLRRLAVRMRRASAAVLAHSLDVGGRRR